MNRLASPPLVASALETLASQSTNIETGCPGSRVQSPRSPVASFAPQHYSAGYAYPLVVWLHGAGNNERELSQVMPYISTRNYVAVAPRGPQRLAGGEPRFGWGVADDLLLQGQERIVAAIEEAQSRFNIHSERVFLAGVGAGATAALRFALLHPTTVAGVAAFDGALPVGGQPLRHLTEVRNLSLLMAVARESKCYPAAQVCRDLRLLHTAGCSVTLRQYPGDDELTTMMLTDLDRWLMSQVSAAGASVVG